MQKNSSRSSSAPETASDADLSIPRLAHRFASEVPARSRRLALETLALLLAAVAITAWFQHPLLRLLASIVTGLLVVRGFVIYHDLQHGAILRGNRIAGVLGSVFGWLVLNPSRIWRETHNFHHSHTAIPETSDIGSFHTVTVRQWRSMTRRERLLYRAERHPITFISSVLTVFAWTVCFRGFLRDPKRNIGGLIALVLNGGIAALAMVTGHGLDWFFAWGLPLAIASLVGSWLFYVQHNYPGVQLPEADNWNNTDSALHASSFLRMPAWMNWFTANIGYHHIHHLNYRIPFYRLPEADRALRSRISVQTIELGWRDMRACLRQNLWDADAGRMITYREAALARI